MKNSPVIQIANTPIAKPVKDITKVPKVQDKRTRGERDAVLDLIFVLFRTHEFYTFNDLVNKTEQPPVSQSKLTLCHELWCAFFRVS